MLDIVFRYKHELALRASLEKIKQKYARHKEEVDRAMDQMWADWNVIGSTRAMYPERYAPGGKLHKEFLSRWHHLRLTLRRVPPGERDRFFELRLLVFRFCLNS